MIKKDFYGISQTATKFKPCFELMNRLGFCNEDNGLDCDGSNDVAPQTKFCELLLNGCENIYYIKYYILEKMVITEHRRLLCCVWW